MTAALFRGASARRINPLWSWLLLAPVLVFLLVLFIVPVFELLSLSVFDPSFTTKHYQTIFSEPLFLRVIYRTFWISFAVSVICVALAFPVAFLMARSQGLLTIVIGACILIPLWTSVLVRSYVWIVLLQRNGLINQWLMSFEIVERPLRLIYTDGAVMLAMVHVLLPFVILPLYASLRSIPDDLYKAASASGAGPFSVFRYILIPLSLPGVAAGFALVFIQSLGFFVTPALVGGPQSMMIATLIGKEIRDGTDWALACALAAVLLATTLVLMVLFSRVLRIERVTGDGR